VRLISLSRIHIICCLSRLPYYKVSNMYTRRRKGAWHECVTQCNEWPPFEALTSPPTLCAFSRERKAPGAVNLKHVICKVVMVSTVAIITVGCLKYPSMHVCRLKEIALIFMCSPTIKKKKKCTCNLQNALSHGRIHVYESLRRRNARNLRRNRAGKKMVNR